MQRSSEVAFCTRDRRRQSTEYFTETALCIPRAVAAQINKTLAAYVIEARG